MPLPLIGWAVIGGTLVYLLAKDNEETNDNPEDKESKGGEANGLEVNREEVRRLRSELRKAQKKLRASSSGNSPSGKK